MTDPAKGMPIEAAKHVLLSSALKTAIKGQG